MNALVKMNDADTQLLNSLSGLCASVGSQLSPFAGIGIMGDQLSQSDTLFFNNRWYLVSNLRNLLTQLYVEHGIVQTLVDQPVDDAWRAGYEIKSGMLSGEDIEDLQVYDEEFQVTASYMQARKWARLYGGGGVMIITDQDPATPLNIDRINEKTPIEFRACDMWELYYSEQNVQATPTLGGQLGMNLGDYYDYYGKRVHKSRVLIVKGKECPSFLRPRLRGWGMSELERLVRSLNQYMKNQDVIFSLLDEAKVDVYAIKGFTQSMIKKQTTDAVARRIQLANQLKSFNNALIMDSEDKYEQKQIAFAGLAEILLQIRQGLAADLKMPMTKLFGVSAAGFSSGEDDIENYNSMLDSEIRKKDKFLIVQLLRIAAKKRLGVYPDDLLITPNSLRILNAKEEEEVKTSKFNRVTSALDKGIMKPIEAKQAINKASLLPVEVKENDELYVTDNSPETLLPGQAEGNAGKQAKTEA